jgi:hypothetical protein
MAEIEKRDQDACLPISDARRRALGSAGADEPARGI